jgi:hypothetical protein
MKRFARVLVLLLLPAAVATAARAGVLEETNVQGWMIGAYTDDRTGSFSHCATSVPYRSGISLFFHLGKSFTWSMGLHNPQWHHAPGQTFNLIYYIDNGPSIPVRAVVTQSGLVSIPLADSQALFQSFQRGRRLYVRDASETFVFNLTSSSQALAATLNCVQRYAYGAAPPARASKDGDFKAEAAILAANVLSASGIQGFRILPRDQVPAEAARFDAVWVADGGLIGTVHIVTGRGASSVDEVVASLTALDSKGCRGAFSSGRYPTDETGVGRLVTLCSGVSAPEVQYTVVRRRAGGFFVLGVTGQETGANAVLEAGTRVYDVALRALASK